MTFIECSQVEDFSSKVVDTCMNYRQVVVKLRQHCQFEIPVQVRRIKLPDVLDGDCKIKDGRISIRVNKMLEEHEAIETAIHEFSHALCFQSDQNYQGEHNALWGKNYAKLYSEIIDRYYTT